MTATGPASLARGLVDFSNGLMGKYTFRWLHFSTSKHEQGVIIWKFVNAVNGLLGSLQAFKSFWGDLVWTTYLYV